MKQTLIEEGAAFMTLEGHELRRRESGSGAQGGSAATPPTPAVTERFPVIVVGAGQAGLSAGYHLARAGVRFVILDAEARVGDVWRRRWDSLRLFTPAIFDGLDGMAFPAPPWSFPTKDQMADFLEEYARRFALPIRHGVRVDSLTREGDGYVLTAGSRRFEARHVVVAMASYQVPRVPEFAKDLDPRIVQISSRDYRNPSQLRGGRVLVVGAGNSGSEIALDVARGHRVWMSGRDVGSVPFRISGFWARLFLTRLVLRGIFHRLLTVDTPIGRRVRRARHGGTPLIRVQPRDLAIAGIMRAPRVAGVRNGMPLLEDGTVLEVENVIWATGFHPGLSWIGRPILDETGEPRHDRGIVPGEPGLYFVGLHFLYAMSSTMIHGVGRDARRVVREIARRVGAERSGGRERRPARPLAASAVGGV